MTIGTATVARTKVRRTVDNVRSQSPSSRLMTVRVGKTQSQIMSASWCFVGGWTGVVARPSDMAFLLGWLEDHGSVGTAVAERLDGAPHVLLDQVGVEGHGGRRSLARGRDDLGTRAGRVPGDPYSGHAGAPGRVGDHPAVVVDGAAEAGEQVVVRDEVGADEDRGAADHPAVVQLDAVQTVVLDEKPCHGAVDDADRARD